jgi:uncharacterized tellurite resistance protein B-like protein
MFDKLKEFFSGEKTLEASLEVDQSGKPSDRDLQVACAVLLVEMARVDNAVAPAEGHAVVRLMSDQFQIGEAEVPKLVETALEARKSKGKIDEFVKCINQRFSSPQKKKLLAMIWKVVLADSAIERDEERMAVQMRFRLQLSEEDAAEARRMAESGEV